MLDKKVFAENFIILCEVFDKTPIKGLISIYYEVLKKLNNDEFKTAMQNLLSSWSYNYMPKPANFLNSMKQDPESLEIEAQNEWNTIVEAIEEHGGYVSVKFENIITSTVLKFITVGNWYNLASKNYKELEWIKKDFVKLYMNLKNNPKNLSDEPLLGFFDKQNNSVDLKAVKAIKSNLNTNMLENKKNSTQMIIEGKKEINNPFTELKIKRF